MKNKALISAIFFIFLLLGSVSAADIDANNSNLINKDNDISLKSLDVSSNYSVSESNSHDDNLDYYPNDDDFNAKNIDESNHEDNWNLKHKSANNSFSKEDKIDQNNYTILDSNNNYNNVENIEESNKNNSNQNIINDSSAHEDMDNNNSYTSNKNITAIHNQLISADNSNAVSNNTNQDTCISNTLNSNINRQNTSTITSNLAPTIEAKDVVKYYKNNTQYSASFSRTNGQVLSNTNVTLIINNQSYTRTTDANGTAMLSINLDPGSYVITAINPINNESYSTNITVLPTVNGSDVVKYYRNATQYSASFLRSNGEALANTNVTFNINGVFYTKMTDENGTAMLSINLNPGSYIITAINPIDNQSYSNNITVLSTVNGSDVVKYYRNGTQYSASFLKGNGEALANTNVTFNINGVFYTKMTDENGTAMLSINLNPGSYIITAINPINNESYSNNITVLKGTPIIIGEDVQRIYGTTFNYTVLLCYDNNTPITDQVVYFKINNKTYNVRTNENGTATIFLSNLPYGLNLIKYGITDSIGFYPISNSSNIDIINSTTILIAENLTIAYGQIGEFKVLLTDLNDNPLPNKTINVVINNKSYNITTNKDGIANLTIGKNYPQGTYMVQYSYSTPGSTDYNYGSSIINIINNTVSIEANKTTFKTDGTAHFDVTVRDSNGNLLTNGTVIFTINSVDYYKNITKGVASINITLSAGSYIVYYRLAPNAIYQSPTYNTTIKLIDDPIQTISKKISINSLIKAAITVRNYIENNYKLPNTITIDGSAYTMPQFLYLISKAIVGLNSGITYVDIINVSDPKNPVSTQTILGNLYNYVDVAKNIIKFIDENGLAPNSVSSDIGTIGYDALIYALTRVVAWYGEHNNTLPAYTSVKPVNMPNIGVLDSVNTINNLTPYLEPSTNCQVNNAQIQSLASKLTKGLTSELSKANAIYNYVRDTISYSSYYNTRYGAVNTLTRGYGNCCDQTQLLVALCRAAGLYARFVHSKYCHFNSGTYGHVFAQILIGNTWIVADTTSSRNSFGVVKNWNNNNHGAFTYYRSLPF